MNSEVTLITGASSGIGLHLAHEFAAHGHPLVLVAPVAAELEAIAAELSTRHGVQVEVAAKDLEQPESAREIYEHLKGKDIEVEILVNNAGHGFWGKSWEIPLEKSLSIVRLNIEAVLRMTNYFLPPMLARGSGRILNTASIAGFEAGPLLNVYHASKAFVLSWSEGLAVEAEDTGVTVTALCPGVTDTDFFLKADMEAVKGFQKSEPMAPQEVAKAGYEALMRGELFIVPGAKNKAMVAARRLLSDRAMAKLGEWNNEKVLPQEQKRQRGDVEREVVLAKP